MIKATDLSFGYKNKKVLNGISLTLEKGELCSVIGVNGCGKTTLIHLLDRTLTPDTGEIEVDQFPSSSYSSKDHAKKISKLSQHRSIPAVSVSQLLESARYPYLGFSGRLSPTDVSAIDSAVRITGIDHLLDRSVRELSGGERQRAYFAMLLAQDTPYVLLDEPSTHLDIPGKLDLYRLIDDLKKLGKGILAVSHDLSFTLKHSDKLLILDGGRTAFYGSPSSDSAIPTVERVFKVKCIEFADNGEKEYLFK